MPALVTCIVAVYNGEPYLDEALDSILGQTYAPIEVIVVDDGSTDGTAELARRRGEPVTLIQQANAGPAGARNVGLAHARGDFIAFLDADDLWHAKKIERQMARFEARPELGMSVTLVQNFWAPGLEDEATRFKDHRLARPAAGYSTVALLARRSVFERIGPFDTSWRHVHDTEWFVRAADTGVVTELVDDVLVSRRLHQTSRSRLGAEASREEYLRLVRSRIARGAPARTP